MRSRIADWLMPWVARNATVWPSQHAMHANLLEEIERLREALKRAHDALDTFHDHTPETWEDRQRERGSA